jgi:hypothetical protein
MTRASKAGGSLVPPSRRHAGRLIVWRSLAQDIVSEYSGHSGLDRAQGGIAP